MSESDPSCRVPRRQKNSATGIGKVCWELDKITSEANYDIDEDPVREKGPFLIAEMNVTKKQDKFEADLKEKLAVGRAASGVANLDLYAFTLENGFLPQHASACLKRLQAEGKLHVDEANPAKPPRRGSFYLGWGYYRDNDERAVYRLKD